MSKQTKMVSQLRRYLNRLASKRVFVTADDVQNYLSKKNYRGSMNQRLSLVRSVLNDKFMTPAGMVSSTRKAARGRMIRRWEA